MSFPQNIFFYWNDRDIPPAVIENVNFYKKLYPDFRVLLTNDDDIAKYMNVYPTLIYLFQRATIPALKSDIARMILLNELGGIYIDCNTTLKDKEAIHKIFKGCEKYNFAFTVVPHQNFNLKASAMLAKPKTEIASLMIDSITKKLLSHYQAEKSAGCYIPYNYFLWVAPVVAHDLLGYRWDVEFRNMIKETYSLKSFFMPDISGFKKYECGLFVANDLLKFYGTNMEHHHNSNFHLHWSNLQKTQRLFFN
jgi:hypothetical protein